VFVGTFSNSEYTEGCAGLPREKSKKGMELGFPFSVHGFAASEKFPLRITGPGRTFVETLFSVSPQANSTQISQAKNQPQAAMKRF